jgi:hypothetical protein
MCFDVTVNLGENELSWRNRIKLVVLDKWRHFIGHFKDERPGSMVMSQLMLNPSTRPPKPKHRNTATIAMENDDRRASLNPRFESVPRDTEIHNDEKQSYNVQSSKGGRGSRKVEAHISIVTRPV